MWAQGVLVGGLVQEANRVIAWGPCFLLGGLLIVALLLKGLLNISGNSTTITCVANVGLFEASGIGQRILSYFLERAFWGAGLGGH